MTVRKEQAEQANAGAQLGYPAAFWYANTFYEKAYGSERNALSKEQSPPQREYWTYIIIHYAALSNKN